jgi:hypothetical protein
LLSSPQGTCGGVLRGTGKQKIGAILNAIGYYVFGFPIGVSLMFAAKLGIIGMCLIPQGLASTYNCHTKKLLNTRERPEHPCLLQLNSQ